MGRAVSFVLPDLLIAGDPKRAAPYLAAFLINSIYLRFTLQTKDYYKILDVPPSATAKEIKSAYRRLAHEFHPDKNNNDQYAGARFEIIKEAYEVLSNPAKKDYYLQQRWYDQVMNKKSTDLIVSPVTVLKQFLELDRYVSGLDVYRMDNAGLYNYICGVLSDETIEKLNAFSEKDINSTIIDSALKSSRSLPLSFATALSGRLMKLNADAVSPERIRRFVHHSKRTAQWNNYKIWIVLFVVLILCYLIYSIGS